MRSKSGSTFVEAAMIFPVLILIIAGMISGALTMYEEVKGDSLLHRSAVLSQINVAGADICLIMRAEWVLK